MPQHEIKAMHFRVRKNVVQLVRTTYDASEKKPKATVVGRIPLDRPEITDELRVLLTPSEAEELQEWVSGQHRMTMLREELAALSLAENLELADRWFARQGDSRAAAAAAAAMLQAWQSLRKTLKAKGLLG
jgi:hypothetical protein